MAKRPPIPSELERQVLIESGHRCAIHTCRQDPVEIAHITPWSRCKAHVFSNLIALCPTCHTRFDRGQIDRRAMLAYKQAAWWRNDRYSDLERRLIVRFVTSAETEAWLLDGLRLLLDQLCADGLLLDTGQTEPAELPQHARERLYRLTAAGAALVHAMRVAEPGGEHG